MKSGKINSLPYLPCFKSLKMLLERYDLVTNIFHTSFRFESTGPYGTIAKVIQFTPTQYSFPDGRKVVNLAFGDWNQQSQKLDDLSISNNGDREKILATVAHAVISYTNIFGNIPIFAVGSTPARTRTYQMGITEYHDEITKQFDVIGLFKDS